MATITMSLGADSDPRRVNSRSSPLSSMREKRDRLESRSVSPKAATATRVADRIKGVLKFGKASIHGKSGTFRVNGKSS